MPARPITFSRFAFSRIFAVALVADRIARPSKEPYYLNPLRDWLSQVKTN